MSQILVIITATMLFSAATALLCPVDWTPRNGSCYKWFNQPNYWFEAEQVCRSNQGHLVSIHSLQENTLVSRLAQCRSAWIGKYGIDLKNLNDSRSYAWTDNSNAVSFHRHNFVQLNSLHKPLIRIDGQWWINSLYHEKHSYVCEKRFSHNANLRCPNGWSFYQDHCYFMPDFESNFNEANFYCQRKSSQLVSVVRESELRHINSFIFGIDSCSQNVSGDTVWLGLIKLNPCFPDSGGRELCYQWTDFSGKHVGFPIWQLEHPKSHDWTVNCVTLRGDRLYSEACYNRHRFVCKSAARKNADNSKPPILGSMHGVVAAFDFRKGLRNLVDPNTFVVTDAFNVPVSKENGSCFLNGVNNHNTRTYYRIGNWNQHNETFLSWPQWTVFLRGKFSTNWIKRSLHFLSVSNRHNTGEAAFLASLYHGSTYFKTETNNYQYNPEGNIVVRHTNRWDSEKWNNKNLDTYAISTDNYQSNFIIDGESYPASHSTVNFTYVWPNSMQIFLGKIPPYSDPAEFCISCFGIANRRLGGGEIEKVIKTYCP